MPTPNPAGACVSALVGVALLALALAACSAARTGASAVETNPPTDQAYPSLLASPDPPLIPAIPSEDEADRALSDSIRASLVADGGLAAPARSVTVSSIDGLVTLRGQVDSDAESVAIISQVESMAGVRRVENRITVDHRNGTTPRSAGTIAQ